MKSADTLKISRRDFLNGVALSVAAGSALSPFELMAMTGEGGVYPPALTGMRGNQRCHRRCRPRRRRADRRWLTGVWDTDRYTKIWVIYSEDGSGL